MWSRWFQECFTHAERTFEVHGPISPHMDLKEGDVELTLNRTYIHTYTHTYTHTYIVYGWSLPLLKEDQISHPAQERVATPTGSDYGTYGVLNSFLSEKTRKSKAQCKRMQHSWPSSPNIVGCYMLRPFGHPVAYCWQLLCKV